MFDIKKFEKITAVNTRYEKQLNRLREKSFDPCFIEEAVGRAIQNLSEGTSSFVIYGEPQSGKTEMMICLTAKLLDQGKKIVVVLLNDNVELLKQNLNRFRESGIDPNPKNFTEVTDPNVEIGNSGWIIFCKKNARDLRKLNEKLRGCSEIMVVDDEADYASPNSKKNKGEISRINGLVGELLGDNGTYIGVTATPARLDLNNTFDNANDHWVNFPPHSHYTGQDVFFPINPDNGVVYRLTLLPDHGDDPKYLRQSLFSFLVNVAYLNVKENASEVSYSMLVHTSGKRVDHTGDYKNIQKTINMLKDNGNANFENYVREIWGIAQQRFGKESADSVVTYVLENISRCCTVVMNSDVDKKNVDYTAATQPTSPFTIAIGGNIISRGVTFNNLLSMFFTRDVKHKIQQDTYIQRARMFGSRNKYLPHFELTIPEHLFFDWHKCFVFHRLALESIRSGNGVPVWLEDGRVAAVSASSIDKATVAVDSGEMGFGMFDLTGEVEELCGLAYEGKKNGLEVLRRLHEHFGDSVMPRYVMQYIESFLPEGGNSIAIHKPFGIANYREANQEKIERSRGFIGTTQLERDRFPQAMHHFIVLYNAERKARIYYRYVGGIRFLKNLRKYLNAK
jgi:hypothetical protein